MKMRSRIFISICFACLLTLALCLLSVTKIMYDGMYGELKAEVRNEAASISAALERLGDGDTAAYIAKVGRDIPDRITLIAADGTVQYDNYADPAQMENHGDRPEIEDAVKTGSGEIIRPSDTLGEVTYYYAVRLESGSIIRIAARTKSVGGLLGNSVIWIVITALIVSIAAIITANVLTKTIIRPINSIDLDEPVSNVTYDELSPLLTKMDKQNEKIAAQIEKLSRQKLEFDYVTGNMSEGLVIFGKDGNVITANAAAQNILGGTASDYTELSRDIGYLAAVESALSGEAKYARLEKGDRIYELSATPVEGTEKYGAVLFLMDITDRESAERMRREFSANVSHELKTPLTSILGAAEIIENGIAKKEDIPHFAGQIHAEASRLLALIEDIIKISRLDEDGFRQEFEQVDLEDVCRTVIAELGCKAKDKKVSVEFDGSSAHINGVKPVLHEMIYNLCDNAIAYNVEGGSVKVSLSEEGGNVTLSVADTGIGIPAEHCPRVFERFYRVDKSHSRATGGTGLGLSIVKHGAALHDGNISLESEVGKGTKITVVFPSI